MKNAMNDEQGQLQNTCTGVTRREMALLLCCVTASLVIHGASVLKGFGEPDAARLGWQAAVWARTHELPSSFYTVRTSPLYLLALKTALDMGLPKEHVPDLMNWTSVVFGSLTLIPLYLLWRKFASPRAAAAGLLLYSFMPTFWLGNIYGMPHTPAFFFFCCGLLFFMAAIRPGGGIAPGWYVIACLSAALGVGLKADIVLCYGVFLWLALCAGPVRPRNAALAVAVPLMSLAAAVVCTHLIVSDYISTEKWAQRWPFTASALTEQTNTWVQIMAPGPVLFAAAVLCIPYAALRRRHTAILWLIIFWSVPTMLFWDLKLGNITRHLMVAWAPIALLMGVALAGRVRSAKVYVALLAITLCANYFISPGYLTSWTYLPSSRLFKARDAIQERLNGWHRAGRFFAQLPEERKAIFGVNNSDTISAAWEVLLGARSYELSPDGYTAVVNEDGSTQEVLVPLASPGRHLIYKLGPDWSVWTLAGDDMPRKAQPREQWEVGSGPKASEVAR
jgi:hypothetical protein